MLQLFDIPVNQQRNVSHAIYRFGQCNRNNRMLLHRVLVFHDGIDHPATHRNHNCRSLVTGEFRLFTICVLNVCKMKMTKTDRRTHSVINSVTHFVQNRPYDIAFGEFLDYQY